VIIKIEDWLQNKAHLVRSICDTPNPLYNMWDIEVCAEQELSVCNQTAKRILLKLQQIEKVEIEQRRRLVI